MLKRVQHDKKKCVIPNLFRNLEFGNGDKSIAFALVCLNWKAGFMEKWNDEFNKQFLAVYPAIQYSRNPLF